ncbi:hypothetical protein HHI36_018322, partial [Cryptolaemus montrouzieri]
MSDPAGAFHDVLLRLKKNSVGPSRGVTPKCAGDAVWTPGVKRQWFRDRRQRNAGPTNESSFEVRARDFNFPYRKLWDCGDVLWVLE